MRYLLDTNIFIYWATDQGMLSQDVLCQLNEPDALLFLSAESVRELIIGYHNRNFDTKRWKTTEEMVQSITEVFYIEVLPLTYNIMQTYSRLRPYTQHGHKDPSDHVIISHAITEKLVLVSSDTRFPYYTKQGLNLLFNEK